jgi:putative flippase GtrA
MRALLVRLLRYGVTGGIAAIVDAGGFALLLQAGLGVAFAGCTSFGVAAVVNYLLSSRFVFSSGATAQGFARFFVAALIGLLVNVGVTLAGVYWIGLPPVAGKILGIGIAFLVNFTVNLMFVFRVADAAGQPPRRRL